MPGLPKHSHLANPPDKPVRTGEGWGLRAGRDSRMPATRACGGVVSVSPWQSCASLSRGIETTRLEGGEMAIELIGVIRVARRNPKFQGKQFLGVTLELATE